MNYYEPKKRLDGRWDYTRNGAPTGYCCEYRDIDPKFATDAQIEQYRATAHKHHTSGHETELEARECYKEYLLDHGLNLDREMSHAQHKCRVCGEWTSKFAEIGNQLIVLCEQHNNRGEVEKIFQAPDWSASSW